MATIFFALADPDQIRSFSGGSTLIPAGFPNEAILYLVRPSASDTLCRLQETFPDGAVSTFLDDVISFTVPPSVSHTTDLLTPRRPLG